MTASTGSRRYHLIEPSGTVTTAEWTGGLEYGCIPYDRIRELLSYKEIDHVSVIWRGRPAHMFVDELGLMHELQVNPKATRIYMNATFRREGLHDFVYEDLERSPMFGDSTDFAKNLQARVLVYSFRSMIVGRALLWEGGLE